MVYIYFSFIFLFCFIQSMSVSIITLYVTVLKRLASDILGSTLEDIFVIAKRCSISKGWSHS